MRQDFVPFFKVEFEFIVKLKEFQINRFIVIH